MSEESSPLLSGTDAFMAVFVGVVFTVSFAFFDPGESAILVNRPISTPVGGAVYAIELMVLYGGLSAVYNTIRS